jgi:hypothetical protein
MAYDLTTFYRMAYRHGFEVIPHATADMLELVRAPPGRERPRCWFRYRVAAEQLAAPGMVEHVIANAVRSYEGWLTRDHAAARPGPLRLRQPESWWRRG